MIIYPICIILYAGVKFMLENIKIVAELGLLGLLLSYFIDILRQRYKQKQLTKKLTKEVTFELFAEEVALSAIISDFNSLIRNPIGTTAVHRFSLIIIDATLSSGYFINFEHKFNDFLFNIYTRFKNINFEVEQFMKLPDEYKGDNINLLQSGKRHCMEAFESLQNSKIFIDLKKKYLKEWLIEVRLGIDILPEGVEVPQDDEILEFWTGLLKEKAGIS